MAKNTKEKPIDSTQPQTITNVTTSDAIKNAGPAPIQIASEASELARRKQLEEMGHTVSQETKETKPETDSF